MSQADERDLPPALGAHLEGLWEGPPPPTRVSRALAEAARAHLGPAAPNAWWRRRTWLGGVAAAALALVLWLPNRGGAPDDRVAQSTAVRGDINGDRSLDILDARDLARSLRSGAATEASWDLDRDGYVDERDVRAAAFQAVRIDR